MFFCRGAKLGGGFEIPNNDDDPAAAMPPKWKKELPLRPEQLRSLQWMKAKEVAEEEPYFAEFRKITRPKIEVPTAEGAKESGEKNDGLGDGAQSFGSSSSFSSSSSSSLGGFKPKPTKPIWSAIEVEKNHQLLIYTFRKKTEMVAEIFFTSTLT